MQIYRIKNLENGLSYIGKDQSDNKYYMGSGLLLWNSYRKRFKNPNLNSDRRTDHKWVFNQNEKYHYYEKTILDECNNSDQLCELEKYYIKKYNTIRPNGYNIADGGEGGNLVKGYTEEERNILNEKISEKTKEAMQREEVRDKFLKAVQNKDEEWKMNISKSLTGKKGHPMSEANKEKLRQRSIGNQWGLGNKSRTGMKNSEEMNKRISEGVKKVVHTEEWNKKVSESLKGRPKSESHKAKLRKPKPKYKWLLPNGEIVIMDAANGRKHEGWVRLEKVV